MDILTLLLQSVYLMLPGYFANMAPAIFKHILKPLAIPIDFNKKFHGESIFGKNKTYRGFIVGILASILITFVQYQLSNIPSLSTLALVDYSNWLIFGFLMGFGALSGDLIKSFFKRRLDIKAGQPFVPFDQLDFVAGALLFAGIFISLNIYFIVLTLTVSLILHVVTNHIAYYLKIRKERW